METRIVVDVEPSPSPRAKTFGAMRRSAKTRTLLVAYVTPHVRFRKGSTR